MIYVVSLQDVYNVVRLMCCGKKRVLYDVYGIAAAGRSLNKFRNYSSVIEQRPQVGCRISCQKLGDTIGFVALHEAMTQQKLDSLH